MESNREYHDRMRGLLEYAYVAADERGDLFGGSGASGGMAHWAARRRVIANSFDHDGTWLDVGCANGLLMETLSGWTAEKGVTIEPYGLEISERIAERTRKRLPQWANRIWTGDVMEFHPPIRFDYVTVLPEYAPPHRRTDLLRRVAGRFLNPNGRLIVSCYGPAAFLLGYAAPAESAAALLLAAGFRLVGEAEARDGATGMLKTRVAWADAKR